MSVLSMVADPEFQKLPTSDQQAALAGIDPDFGKLNASDFNAAVTGLQRKALTRPDVVAPPSASTNSTQMQEVDALGKPQQAGVSSFGNTALPNWDVLKSGPVSDAVAHGAIGFVKGAAETGHTVARAANALTGDNIAALPTSFTEPTDLQANGTAESIGKGAEGIAEFILGDELLKGADIGSKLLKVGKVADAYENASPFVRAAIEHGMNVARTAAVSGAQSGLHNEDVVRGAETGAIGGAVGEGLGIGANYLKSLTPAAKEAAAVAEATSLQSAKATDELVKNYDLTKGLSNVAHDAVENATGVSKRVLENAAGTNVEAATRSAIDYNFGDAAKDIKEHFNPVFDTLRKSSSLSEGGNLFDEATNQIKIANKVLRNPTSVEAAQTAQKVLTDGESKLNQVYAQSSLGKDELDAARAGWRKASALEDLHDGISSALGIPKSLRNLTGDFPGTINPKQLATRLKSTLKDVTTDELQDALGKDGAKNLALVHSNILNVLESSDAVSKLQKSAQQILKANPSTQGASSASAYVGSGALGVIAHFAGATNPITAAAVGIPATLRWLYTHPTIGSQIVGVASKAAPALSQATKQWGQQFGGVPAQ